MFISKFHNTHTPCHAGLLMITALIWSTSSFAATINVNVSCSLPNAVVAANTNSSIGGCSAGAGNDTIILANGSTHTLSGAIGTIVGASGLVVSSNILIQGNGATITRNNASTLRLIYLSSSGILNLRNLNLTNGNASGSDDDGRGGAIFNAGSLTLNQVVLSNNNASMDGGAIANKQSVMSMNNSTLSGNSAFSQGGGINSADNSNVIITNSAIFGNSAGDGGGLSTTSSSTLQMGNSTVSGNDADNDGGGIYNNSASFTMLNSTVTGNHTNVTGDGLVGISSTITVGNSIIANHPALEDCAFLGGTFTQTGTNWIEDQSCDGSGDGDPALGLLANNGGLTRTHALLANSNAIDAGDNAVCNNPVLVKGVDQRGQSRTAGGQCDIGAFELDQSQFFIVPTPNGKASIFRL